MNRIYYSKNLNGFFSPDLKVHKKFFKEDGVTPINDYNDAVEITETEHQNLLNNQGGGDRKEIKPNANGKPELVSHPLTDEEKWECVRQQRNELLRETDHTQLPDFPQGEKQKWSTYRQKLRDIPQKNNSPNNIKWPTKPSKPNTPNN